MDMLCNKRDNFFFKTTLVSSPLLKRNAIRGRLCRGFNSVICLEKLDLFKVIQVRINTIIRVCGFVLMNT